MNEINLEVSMGDAHFGMSLRVSIRCWCPHIFSDFENINTKKKMVQEH